MDGTAETVMGVKDGVLKELEMSRGEYVSGEKLAATLGVSRNAVSKAVKALNAQGFGIVAIKNRGYMLQKTANKLTKQGIEKYLPDGFFDIIVLESTTSTNTVAKQLATEGAKEGTVVVANEQSNGRGRMGRKFFAPADCGAYFSVILRPQHNADVNQTVLLTVVAGLAVAKAVESVGGKEAKIKWVNDVFVDGKKCAGILSEAISDMESGLIESVVVGIGINITEPKGGFDKEIADIASWVCDVDVADARNRVIASVLKNIQECYLHFDKEKIAKEYRDKSFLIGKEIVVVKGDERRAVVEDIDEDCRLCVRYENGDRERLSTGEVKIKW